VEEIEEKDDLIKIVAYIFTETESQKYIIIWKWWSLLSKIWQMSRIELEEIFWKKVFLALRVKTEKNWRKNEKLLDKIL
jgi:GTP-binding protein Era